MAKCVRCRERSADSGKFATEDWENRCKWCKHIVAGKRGRETLKQEFPEEFEEGGLASPA